MVVDSSSLLMLIFPHVPDFVLSIFAGIGQFVQQFAEPGDPEYAPPVTKGETPVRVLTCSQ